MSDDFFHRLRSRFHALQQLTLWRSLRFVFKWLIGLVIAAVLLFVGIVLWPNHTMPAGEHVDEYVYLNQNWGEDVNAVDRQTYYYTAQGTSMPQGASTGALRYNWFVHLEQALSEQRFADPDHMRRYRFLVDETASPANPDQLPVGFTKHFDPAIGEYVLDITCSACHTGELHYTRDGKTTAIRIDGGQAMHAFTDMQRGNFAPDLMLAMINTVSSPWKFSRFADKVLANHRADTNDSDDDAQRRALRLSLLTTIKTMLSSGQNNPLRNLYPNRDGFGRTDALGRIANTLFGDHLVSSNYHVADAPVSYPYLWNIWKFDWVQYNGSVAQPLARNIGEALGVGAVVRLRDNQDQPLPADQRFRTSVDMVGLQKIEHALQKLQAPQWPEKIFGAVDMEKASQGKQLFETHCRECHGPHPATAARQRSTAPLKPAPDLEWQIEVIPLDHIGTDANATRGFMKRRYDLSSTGITSIDIQQALLPLLDKQLSRDVRFRLDSVIAARTLAKKPLGQLPTLLSNYPQHDANAALPSAYFAEIDRELMTLEPTLQTPASEPEDALECALECQTNQLLWNLRQAHQANQKFVADIDIRQINEGLALNIVGILIKNRFYADYGIDYATQECLEGYGALDLPQVLEGYKPRPLSGVWATPPFLHNGSVPSIYQLLSPPEQRDKQFFVGRREYDPQHLGYVTTPIDKSNPDGFWLDTSISGNHNSGHAFAATAEAWQKHHEDEKANPLPAGVIGPQLSVEERFALIEYLKIHQDPTTPPDFQPQLCQLFGKTI